MEKDLCISCGTCVSVCPTLAIGMDLNKTKTCYTPVLNTNCYNCGKCLAVCPGINIHFDIDNKAAPFYNIYLGFYQSIYYAHSNNELIRKESSSGGAITSLLLFMIHKRLVDYVIVTKMKSDGSLEPEVIITDSVDDIFDARGSKYCPVSLNSTLNSLQEDKKYAIVGLPCHLMGLEYLIKQKPFLEDRIIYKFGLFCSRVPSFRATKYLLLKNGIQLDLVKSIRYRGCGHPGCFQAELTSGEIKKIEHLSFHYWKYAFAKYFMQYRCWLCPDKTAFYSDLAFADDWTIPISSDILGRSTIVVRSRIGGELINQASVDNVLTIGSLDCNNVIESQALKQKMNIGIRRQIARFFTKKVPICNLEFPKCKGRFLEELLMFIRICISKILHEKSGIFIIIGYHIGLFNKHFVQKSVNYYSQFKRKLKRC